MNTRHERIESALQITILILIAGMAGAASFTHVHDWTMANSPKGTGDWFGWANAVISELTPTAAGLEIRRRKRHGQPIGYPMTVLIAAAALSLAAQVARATPSGTGWLLAAVPALAFLALSKLVLSRHTPPTTNDDQDEDDTTPVDQHHQDDHTLAVEPTAVLTHTETAADTVPPELMTGVRMAAFTHHQTTGEPITPDALAEHLGITRPLAAASLHLLNGDTPGGGRP